jgi:mannose/fructose/N-acetylgalactosamine-specific phosphotransferase system component IIC
LFVKIIIISLVGSLLCLDRILVQAMISRPIIIAPVLGLILGNPYAGLIIGAILELFWIDRIPIGIYMPPNDSIASAFAASVAILSGQALGNISKELIALSVLLAIPFGIVAKIIDVKIMAANNFLSDQALEDAKARDIRAIERKIWVGLIRMFLLYLALLFVLLTVFTPLVIWLYPKLPLQIKNVLSLMYYFLPILGIAVALNTIKLRGAIPIFCVIFLILAAAMELFHVF